MVDVVEHMALSGIHLSHETVRFWSQRIGTDIAVAMRHHRYKKSHHKWNKDITYLKAKGYDMYLYRSTDKEGNLIDVHLSDTRDKKAAEAFFKSCALTT